jgi:hypothetical protein
MNAASPAAGTERSVGLVLEIVSLLWFRPLSFVLFAFLAASLIGLGILVHLVSLVFVAPAPAGNAPYGLGCAVADHENDGFDDIYITTVGSNHLFHNLGNGKFPDVALKAGVVDPRLCYQRGVVRLR